jgi:hypothetical protein
MVAGTAHQWPRIVVYGFEIKNDVVHVSAELLVPLGLARRNIPSGRPL